LDSILSRAFKCVFKRIVTSTSAKCEVGVQDAIIETQEYMQCVKNKKRTKFRNQLTKASISAHTLSG